MCPAWFAADAIPWGECLPDVRSWYLLAIQSDTSFVAQFSLGERDTVLWESVQTVGKLPGGC